MLNKTLFEIFMKKNITTALILAISVLTSNTAFAKTVTKKKSQTEQSPQRSLMLCELGSTKFDAAFRGKEVTYKEGKEDKKVEYYDDIYLCDYQNFKFTATSDEELKKIITESGLRLVDVKTASFKANQKLMILTVER